MSMMARLSYYVLQKSVPSDGMRYVLSELPETKSIVYDR